MKISTIPGMIIPRKGFGARGRLFGYGGGGSLCNL
jgi:hypothetical protein